MSTLNYSQQTPGGWLDRLATKKRADMLQIFFAKFPAHGLQRVLDVGVTGDRNAVSSNYFEHLFPDKHKIIAYSNQDATFLETVYPGLTFVKGDARDLPFAANSIDVVFSSAVIEHVGSYQRQLKMLAECYRVAKQGIFITTPNRWHPIEVHTLLPLLHWLPRKMHRYCLHTVGLTFYAQETNLNLLDRQTFITMAQQIGMTHYEILRIKTFAFTSNLIFIAYK